MSEKQETQAVYSQLRTLGVGARWAHDYTTRNTKHPRIAFTQNRGSFIIAGARVSVVLQPDPKGWKTWGREVYGEFVEQWVEGAIRAIPGSPREWFLPRTPYWPLRARLAADKIGRVEADQIARRIVHGGRVRAFEHARGDWSYQRAVITVRYKGRVEVDHFEGLERERNSVMVSISGLLYRQAERMVQRLKEAA